MSIGKRIRKLRDDANITQEELAIHINSTKQTIYKYENDIITNIPSDKIEKIAEVLKTDPSYLMGWTSSIKFDSGYEVYFTPEESEYLSAFNKIHNSTPETFEQDVKIFKKNYKNFIANLSSVEIKPFNNFLEFIEIEFPEMNFSKLGGIDNIKQLYYDVKNYTEFSLKKIANLKETPDYIQPVAAHLDGELTDEVKDFIDNF